MGFDVFISYSRKNMAVADQVNRHLTQTGLQCFQDRRSIRAAEVFAEEIARAIKQSHAVLAIVSEEIQSLDYVSLELGFAQKYRKPIVPVLMRQGLHLPDDLDLLLVRQQHIYAEPSLDAKLEVIAEAVWRAVDKARHSQAYAAEKEVLSRTTFSRQIDFSTDRLGLMLGEHPQGTISLVDSGYVMNAKPGEFLGSVMSGCPRLTDAILEAKLGKLSGADDEWFGFEFGDYWPGNYYQFLLNGAGSIRIGKHFNKEWHTIIQRDQLSQAHTGNAENTFKVVRRGPHIHVFVNGRHAVSTEDGNIRPGRPGLVVGRGLSVRFAELSVAGWAIDEVFRKALRLWEQLDVNDARTLAHQIEEVDHAYRHRENGFELQRLFNERRPDRKETVLIVIGQGILPQIHDSIPANRLKEEINRRGNGKLRTAFLITDTGLLAEELFQTCPLISVGGPMTNKLTANLSVQLPTDPASTDSVTIQHHLAGGDRRVALWGQSADDTAQAVHRFIESGLLDRYLAFIWKEE